LLCAQYFKLPFIQQGEAGQSNKNEEPAKHVYMGEEIPLVIRNSILHIGSFAFGALLQLPLQFVKGVLRFFLPDRPNLYKSPNPGDKIVYYVFYPIIQLDLHLLRFFTDSVYVMIALKGYNFFQAARRAQGLLNRSRGKVPNLVKFTTQVDMFMHLAVGLLVVTWTFFLFREPREKSFHGFHDSLPVQGAFVHLFETPSHSPLLALPVTITFGMSVGTGMMDLVTMASETLTLNYCIDVEMAGGTETDALYVTPILSSIYKDMGGTESERLMKEMLDEAQGQAAEML
jgi:hypothetical protein